jgi:TRAP-type C4-dicarboxylate transport system substrate-binding protein
VTIKVFPSGQLGGEKDNAAGLKSGVLDLGIIAVEFYPSFVAESAVLVLPYMYKDYQHTARVLNSDVAKDISKMILDKTDASPTRPRSSRRSSMTRSNSSTPKKAAI